MKLIIKKAILSVFVFALATTSVQAWPFSGRHTRLQEESSPVPSPAPSVVTSRVQSTDDLIEMQPTHPGIEQPLQAVESPSSIRLKKNIRNQALSCALDVGLTASSGMLGTLITGASPSARFEIATAMIMIPAVVVPITGKVLFNRYRNLGHRDQGEVDDPRSFFQGPEHYRKAWISYPIISTVLKALTLYSVFTHVLTREDGHPEYAYLTILGLTPLISGISAFLSQANVCECYAACCTALCTSTPVRIGLDCCDITSNVHSMLPRHN